MAGDSRLPSTSATEATNTITLDDDSNDAMVVKSSTTTPASTSTSIESLLHRQLQMVRILTEGSDLSANTQSGSVSPTATEVNARSNDQYSLLERTVLRQYFFDLAINEQQRVLNSVPDERYLYV